MAYHLGLLEKDKTLELMKRQVEKECVVENRKHWF
jgi:hypothetical protein